MTEWNIQSRARACTGCEKAFADKEHYHTLLFLERADLQRVDVCQECWAKSYAEGAREKKGFVSYWQGVFESPPPPTEAIQKETAETLLRKLIELNNPHYLPAGYILAVMLERKRILKVKEQIKREGRRVFVYEQPRTGDIFTIVDPDLQLNQLEQVQKDVADLLENGLPISAVEADKPTPPADDAPNSDSDEGPVADPGPAAAAPEPEPSVDRQP